MREILSTETLVCDGALYQVRQQVNLTGPFLFQKGGQLSHVSLVVETYGTLSPKADNAILVCHGMTSNQNAAGAQSDENAPTPWWDIAIGPGKMLDTNRYFVICANVPGGSGGSTAPSSIDPATGQSFGMRFPLLTIADIVDIQVRLLDGLGITQLFAAIGGCMGGFQVLELARRHPTRLDRAIAISATPATSAYTIALWELMRQAIYADPDWRGGDYYGGPPPLTGLGLTAMIGSVLWLDRETLADKFGRSAADSGALPPERGLKPDFAVEDFLTRVRGNASARFDPNSLIYLTKAVDFFDLAQGYGNLAEGVSAITMPVTLVSYESDWRYPKSEIKRLARAIGQINPDVSHQHLHSTLGHGAFQFDVSELRAVVEVALKA